MAESKTDRIRKKVNKTVRSKNSETSSRKKIIMAEKRSIIMHKIRKNIFLIVTVIIILSVVLIYTNSNKKIAIDENVNISNLNLNEYSTEIVNLYDRDGQLDKFETEMNRVQTLIGTYLISNSTLNENSFSNLVKTLNSEINKDKWAILNSEKSNYYNGEYIIDNNGNLKFKFGSKKIEPNWINSEILQRYITLN